MEELPVIRRCQYKNCNHIVEGPPQKIYCCKNCRSYAAIEEMRLRNRFKKEKTKIKDILSQFEKTTDQSLVELYCKIYNF